MTTARQRVRQDILRRRGLEAVGYGKLRPESIHLSDDESKTLAMKLIEAKLGVPIEELLLQGKEADIAARLSISESTVSKWRLRLGLRV